MQLSFGAKYKLQYEAVNGTPDWSQHHKSSVEHPHKAARRAVLEGLKQADVPAGNSVLDPTVVHTHDSFEREQRVYKDAEEQARESLRQRNSGVEPEQRLVELRARNLTRAAFAQSPDTEPVKTLLVKIQQSVPNFHDPVTVTNLPEILAQVKADK